ncbi:hypothetical protein B0H10DRAFT_1941629 [Mycena sp. CBHHK59/15]|nr:hypothetical protein B0H10DRAFT_1941629 [Mycena sp. CBHHK59/15]
MDPETKLVWAVPLALTVLYDQVQLLQPAWPGNHDVHGLKKPSLNSEVFPHEEQTQNTFGGIGGEGGRNKDQSFDRLSSQSAAVHFDQLLCYFSDAAMPTSGPGSVQLPVTFQSGRLTCRISGSAVVRLVLRDHENTGLNGDLDLMGNPLIEFMTTGGYKRMNSQEICRYVGPDAGKRSTLRGVMTTRAHCPKELSLCGIDPRTGNEDAGPQICWAIEQRYAAFYELLYGQGTGAFGHVVANKLSTGAREFHLLFEQ